MKNILSLTIVLLFFGWTQAQIPLGNDRVIFQFTPYERDVNNNTNAGFELRIYDEYGAAVTTNPPNLHRVYMGVPLRDDPDSSNCECDRPPSGTSIEDFCAPLVRSGCERGSVLIYDINPDNTISPIREIFPQNLTTTLNDGANFGYSVNAGNFDGDAFTDIIVGIGGYFSVLNNATTGAAVLLRLNGNGDILEEFLYAPDTVPQLAATLLNRDRFGASVQFMGDIDGNGVPDFAVAADQDAELRANETEAIVCPLRSNGGLNDPGLCDFGAIYILLMNANGTVLDVIEYSHFLNNTPTPVTEDNVLGRGMGAADLDGDGRLELLVGQPNADNGCTANFPNCRRGGIRVWYLNTTAQITREVIWSSDTGIGPIDDDDRFGSSVQCIGDLDGDGVAEIASAAVRDDDGGTNRGAVYILFFNATGDFRFSLKMSDLIGGLDPGFLANGDRFGQAITSVGDLNGDGIPDLLLTYPDDDGGLDPGSDVGGALVALMQFCGDSRITGAETCDDGNLQNGDGCNSLCQIEAGFSCTSTPSTCVIPCGDGFIFTNFGIEECDDGNQEDGDGCDSSCSIESGWSCSSTPSLCDEVCGDTLTVGDEECDDGNQLGGDGCSEICLSESSATTLSAGGIAGVAIAAVAGCVLLLIVIVLIGFLLAGRRKYTPSVVHLNDNKTIHTLSNIKILEKIGSGQFGEVYKGTWEDKTVALKTVTNADLRELFNEINIMNELKHPNVLDLFGVYVQNEDHFIVSEFMDKGDLNHILQQDYEITIKRMNKFCRQIAVGMEHLHSKKIIHRDLATRNVLVTSSAKGQGYVLKIADFGLSRQATEYYLSQDTKSKKIPIRWTSPEALLFNKFVQQGDVWSFGVVLFEVFSRGQIPYAGISNNSVFKRVTKKKYTLAPPQEMPENVAKIMKSCFAFEPTDRPSFEALAQFFKGTRAEVGPSATGDVPKKDRAPDDVYNRDEDEISDDEISPSSVTSTPTQFTGVTGGASHQSTYVYGINNVKPSSSNKNSAADLPAPQSLDQATELISQLKKQVTFYQDQRLKDQDEIARLKKQLGEGYDRPPNF